MPKIMLVEDDNNLREIYGARLQAEGYDIVSAKDGEEALAMAVKEKPDLIISDVMMPRISGFDMLDILRNAPETKETKVIMMTALSQAEDKARADKLGADRYLVKSQVTLEDVANVVKEVIGGDAAASTDAAVAAPDATTPAPTTETPPAEPVPAAETPAPVPEPALEIPVEQPAAADVTPTPVTPADPVVITPTTPAPADDDTASTTSTDDATTATSDETPAIEPVPGPKIPPVEVKAEAPAVETPAEPIKVELPAAATETPSMETNDAATTAADKPAETLAPAAPAPADDKPAGSDIGPNVTEALAAEAKEESSGTSEAPAPEPAPEIPTVPVKEEAAPVIPDLPPIVPPETSEPTPAETPPAEAPVAEPTATKIPVTMVDTPETTPPSIANGTQTHTMVQPTQPTPGTPDEPAGTPTESYLEDKPVNISGKKVISPINDLTSKPDLNALLAAEEHKAAVPNPAINTIITPGQAPQVANPQPGETITTVQVDAAPETPPAGTAKKDELNNISL